MRKRTTKVDQFLEKEAEKRGREKRERGGEREREILT